MGSFICCCKQKIMKVTIDQSFVKGKIKIDALNEIKKRVGNYSVVEIKNFYSRVMSGETLLIEKKDTFIPKIKVS